MILPEGEREVLISSNWYPVTRLMEVIQNCIKGGSDVAIGNISLLRGLSNIGTGLIERRLMSSD